MKIKTIVFHPQFKPSTYFLRKNYGENCSQKAINIFVIVSSNPNFTFFALQLNYFVQTLSALFFYSTKNKPRVRLLHFKEIMPPAFMQQVSPKLFIKKIQITHLTHSLKSALVTISNNLTSHCYFLFECKIFFAAFIQYWEGRLFAYWPSL